MQHRPLTSVDSARPVIVLSRAPPVNANTRFFKVREIKEMRRCGPQPDLTLHGRGAQAKFC